MEAQPQWPDLNKLQRHIMEEAVEHAGLRTAGWIADTHANGHIKAVDDAVLELRKAGMLRPTGSHLHPTPYGKGESKIRPVPERVAKGRTQLNAAAAATRANRNGDRVRAVVRIIKRYRDGTSLARAFMEHPADFGAKFGLQYNSFRNYVISAEESGTVVRLSAHSWAHVDSPAAKAAAGGQGPTEITDCAHSNNAAIKATQSGQAEE